METYYSILEIPESATPEEIRQAYRLLLQVWHPDRFHHNPDLLAKAEKKTREINAAFATLSNPALKQRYDEGRPTSRARQEPRKRKPSGDEARTTRCPNSACASVLRVNATTIGIVTCPSCRTTFRYDPERDEKWDIIPPEGNEVFTPARMAMSAIVLVFAIVIVWTATAKTKTLVSNKPAHTHTDEHESLPGNASTAETPHEHMDRLEPMQRQMAQTSGRAPSPSPDIISDVDLQQLKTLATQGSPWAQSQLGQLYANGRGVPQDYATARGWYEKAAVQGHAGAQSQLGQLYADGRGVPQDYKKARQWWEQAALQGNPQAQFNLGQLYANGRGMAQDYTTARGWYEKAAVQGHAWAQAQLGQLYANGRGVSQDYATARGWYEKSAAQGNAWAQAQLALM
jgi:curved DNA-binding protein CbpA